MPPLSSRHLGQEFLQALPNGRYAKIALQAGHEAAGLLLRHAVNEPVRRQDREALVGHVDERHHPVVEALAPRGALPPGGPHLVPVVDCRLVPVVAVRYEEELVLHDLGDPGMDLRIPQYPDPVSHAVYIGRVVFRGPLDRAAEEGVDRVFRVRVEHEYLAELGPRGAHQVQPVGLGAGQSPLVGLHSPAELLQLAQGDEAAPRLGDAVDAVRLIVKVYGGFRILDQRSLVQPRIEVLTRADILIVRIIVIRPGLPLDDPHDVLRVEGIVLLLELGADPVVRLRDDSVYAAHRLDVVSHCAKREYLRHIITSYTVRGDVL